MSRKLAATFLRAALGPLQYAAGLVSSNNIKKGVAELDGVALFEALRRGTKDVAGLSGLPVKEIEALLPMDRFISASEKLIKSQSDAAHAWKIHTGDVGFLDVMTALTVDGRKPEIGMCLERVAKKLHADTALAVPLRALAGDVTEWEELITQSMQVLEDGGPLARAYARRRLRLSLLAVIPVTLIVASLILAWQIKSRRDRIDATLGATKDPCSPTDFSEWDMRFASAKEEKSLGERKVSCEELKKLEAQKAEVERAAKELAEKEMKAKKDHQDACALVAQNVRSGSYTAGDGGTVVPADAQPLLARVAKKALNASDIGPGEPTFPCADLPASHQALEAGFGDAIVANHDLWVKDGDPSPFTTKLLTDRKDSLDANWLRNLADRAEKAAEKALLGGNPEKMATAKRVCLLARALGNPGRGNCAALERLP